jgi:hypothetical protein
VIRLSRQLLVLPLAAYLLLVPALAAPATVSHEMQHAHHKATTHSSALCSWFCGAGQGIGPAESAFLPAIEFLATLDLQSVDRADAVIPVLFLSRGPPATALSC